MAQLSEVCNPPVDVPQSTWQMFEDGANKDLDAPVLTACHQAGDHCANLLPAGSRDRPHSCLRWTYRELRYAALVVSKAMADLGVKRGSTIIVPIPNGIETHIVRIVSFILQLNLVALSSDLGQPGRKDELAYFIKTMSPEIVIVPDALGANAIDKTAQEIDFTFDFKFTTRHSQSPGWTSWASIDSQRFSDESLESLAGQQQEELDQQGDRVTLVLFTSGTSTGQPKGVPQTVRNVVSGAQNQMWIEDLPSSFAISSPHSRAIYACMCHMSLASGHHIILPHTHFTPESTFEAIQNHNVEMLLFIPSQLKIMAAQRSLDWTKLKSVRRVLLGGDVITTDLMQYAERLFPNARVTTLWGMSEGTGMVGLRGTDITPPLPTYHSVVTVGKPARSARVRIADADGNPLPRGEAGELVVSGPAMVVRYIDNVQPELFFRDSLGSWIRTGDKAVMDNDDYIYMIGRTKDIIKQSGINLSPSVAEATLNKHEGINAAIVGVPHPIRGEVPVAVDQGRVTHRRRSSIKEIVTESLGQDYALKEVYGLEELGMREWPFSAQGKIQKFKLKEAILRLEREREKQTYGHFGRMFYPWFI